MISTSIKVAMAKSGINQKELSKRSGVSETTISQTVSEKTSPNTKTVAKIAKGLGLTYSDLMKGYEG